METVKIKLYEPTEPQRAALDIIYNKKPLISLFAFGRQVGKTFMMIMDAITYCLNNDGVSVAFISPTWQQNNNVMAVVDNLFNDREEEKKIVFKLIKYKEQKYLFHNGSEIEFMSAEQGDAIRGRTKHRVYIDEAAFMKYSFIFQIVLPFITRTNGQLILGSTFNGRNWFYKLYKSGLKKGNKEGVISLKRTYLDLNDQEVNKVIDGLRQTMTKDAFEQEVMCNPVVKDGLFTNVEGAVGKANKEYNDKLFIAWDLGVSSDFTVVTVMNQKYQVVEMDRFNMRENSLTPKQFKHRLLKLYRKYYDNIVVGYMEINNNELLYDEIMEEPDTYKILPIITGAENKNKWMANLIKLFDDGEIVIPDNDLLIEELNGYRAKRTDSWRIKYQNVDAEHDDMVMSLALAAYCVREEGDSGIIEIY